MNKQISLTALVLVAFIILDVGFQSQHAAQSRPERLEFISDEVIVKFRQGVDEFTKDSVRFRVSGTRKKLFRYVPGLEVVKLRRGVSVEEAIRLYEQDPNVIYAEPNYILKTTLTPNDPRYATGEMWGLNNFGQSGGTPNADINAPEAWNKKTGDSNVIVAIIDSGIDYNHPDLSTNMFRNEADCNNNGIDDDGNGHIDDCYGIDTHNNDSNPMDDNNHGTHVAGTIGAKGNNGIGVVGINWNIRMMACKFVNASGSGTTESAIECLEYVKTMKDRGYNIIATSNSWGGGGFSQALYDAIDDHRQRGILFITAAGNGNFFGFPINNDQTAFYPCTYYLPNIICVASTTRNDERSSFSNYGRRTVHIGAPGSDILSTTRNGNYGFSSGTSMATPHVTGVAALLKAENPNRDWRAIKNLILAGGDNVSSMSDTITGRRLNADGAMTCSNSEILSRLKPIAGTINGSVGIPIDLSALYINCANPADPDGNVLVMVGGAANESVTLLDDGSGPDQALGDGIYSGAWVPQVEGNYTLTFPGGDVVVVSVATPLIEVTPNSLDFGAVNVGESLDKNFTVKNVGAGQLSGMASTTAPYAIVAGESYNLNPGQSQTVSVRFAPNATGSFLGNVNFTGGGGSSKALTGNAVIPAKIQLSFDGKLGDRVGRGQVLGADGAMDGTLTVTLEAGSGDRTVTSIQLRRSDSGSLRWNTTWDSYWVLGAAESVGGPLYNNSDTSVNFALAEGGTFKLFAADSSSNSYFPEGAPLTVTVVFADGSTATASTTVPATPPPPPPPPPPPSPVIQASFDGKLGDRVGRGQVLGADGAMDGTLTVTLEAGSGDRTVTSIQLRRSDKSSLRWNTTWDSYWVLGAAESVGGPLYNNSDTSVNFALAERGTFKLFAADARNNSYFPEGAPLTVTVVFADGSTATASTTVPSTATSQM